MTAQKLDPGRYVSDGRALMWHLDGVDWYEAPNPPWRHKCWAQTVARDQGWVFRCACGAIALDNVAHFMQKNANLDPNHTIYSGDYCPTRRWWRWRRPW